MVAIARVVPVRRRLGRRHARDGDPGPVAAARPAERAARRRHRRAWSPAAPLPRSRPRSLWLLTTLVVFDVLRDRPCPAGAVLPHAVRRWVLVACGAALSAASSRPRTPRAAARSRAGQTPPRPCSSACRSPIGRPRPPSGSGCSPALVSGPRRRPSWSPPGTPCGAWPPAACRPAPTTPRSTPGREIYRANREAVGADPDLIRPRAAAAAARRPARPSVPPLRRGAVMPDEPFHDRVVPLRRPTPLASVQGTSRASSSARRPSRTTPPLTAVPDLVGPSATSSRRRRALRAGRVEIAGGDRPVGRCFARRRPRCTTTSADAPRWSAPRCCATPRPGAAGPAARRERAHVLAHPRAAEVSVRVRYGRRSRAVAMRFEHRKGRSLAVAVEFAGTIRSLLLLVGRAVSRFESIDHIRLPRQLGAGSGTSTGAASAVAKEGNVSPSRWSSSTGSEVNWYCGPGWSCRGRSAGSAPGPVDSLHRLLRTGTGRCR